MKQPVLYVFAISHFCEKARWALDYHGIDYELAYPPPGVHVKVAKSLGLTNTSVPILQTGAHTLQGSSAIFRWAAMQTIRNHNAPTSGQTAGLLATEATSGSDCASTVSEGVRAIDHDDGVLIKRLEDVIGVHTRRFYYSEALLHHPALVRNVFMQHQRGTHRWVLTLSWPLLRRLMIRGLDLGPTQYLASKARLESELDWLDSLLADGRRWLSGDQFSEVDMTAASLLSPLCLPAEHPVYATMKVPERLQQDIALWQSRPSLQWVTSVYRHWRHAVKATSSPEAVTH